MSIEKPVPVPFVLSDRIELVNSGVEGVTFLLHQEVCDGEKDLVQMVHLTWTRVLAMVGWIEEVWLDDHTIWSQGPRLKFTRTFLDACKKNRGATTALLKLLNVPYTDIRHWQNGTDVPNDNDAKKIALYFGWDVIETLNMVRRQRMIQSIIAKRREAKKRRAPSPRTPRGRKNPAARVPGPSF